MNRLLNVTPVVGTFGLVTFIVLLPVVALLFGIVVTALMHMIF
ncbi:MAG: hypothetical protein ACM3PF_02660 [Bacteroidota bacterium]